jgi:Matrixin
VEPGLTVLPPAPSQGPPPAGRRPWLLVLIAVLSGAITAGLILVVGAARGPAEPDPLDPAIGRPPPGQGEQSQPLGVPEPLARTSGSYSFLRTDDGAPVGFDPCRPVTYVVRTDGAPAYGQETITWAFDRISRATGLRFVDEGTTDEAPSTGRLAYQPQRYGYRWAPVLVAWSWPPEISDLTGPAAGMAGPLSVESAAAGRRVAVSGQVVLDAPQLNELAADPAATAVLRAVVLHEVAHLVGLGHVDDPSQLMHPQTSPFVTDFAAGDLTGLDILGRGPCAPDL